MFQSVTFSVPANSLGRIQKNLERALINERIVNAKFVTCEESATSLLVTFPYPAYALIGLGHVLALCRWQNIATVTLSLSPEVSSTEGMKKYLGLHNGEIPFLTLLAATHSLERWAHLLHNQAAESRLWFVEEVMDLAVAKSRNTGVAWVSADSDSHHDIETTQVTTSQAEREAIGVGKVQLCADFVFLQALEDLLNECRLNPPSAESLLQGWNFRGAS